MAGKRGSTRNPREIELPLAVSGDLFATGAWLPGVMVSSWGGTDWYCTAPAQQTICEAKISLIKQLGLLQPGWDGGNAAPIHPAAVQAVIALLRAVHRACPTLRLGAWQYVQAGPWWDGGLWLGWRVDDWEWVGRVSPDGGRWTVAVGAGIDTPVEAWEEGILPLALAVAQLVGHLSMVHGT